VAIKSLTGRTWNGDGVVAVGHGHCEDCGACLHIGTAHRCYSPMDSRVLEIYLDDITPRDRKGGRKAPNGFQVDVVSDYLASKAPSGTAL
jgi:hypothetical protein